MQASSSQQLPGVSLSPVIKEEGPESVDSTRHRRGRVLASLFLIVIGPPAGALLCSVGFLAVLMFVESTLTPPLRSQENYGQFGFVLLGFGAFGIFYGATFALIPFTRFLIWLPAFFVVALITMGLDFGVFGPFDPANSVCFSQIVIGAFIVLAALVTSMITRLVERVTA